MKYIVYLTTNLVNRKIYVGVHKTENPEIFDGYLGNGLTIYDQSKLRHPKEPFHYAVSEINPWEMLSDYKEIAYEEEPRGLLFDYEKRSTFSREAACTILLV